MSDTFVFSDELTCFATRVSEAVRKGARFGGLFATREPSGTRLLVLLEEGAIISTDSVVVQDAQPQYPALSLEIPAAAWYEREIHDLFGIEAIGPRRLDPLVLPTTTGSSRPRTGSGTTKGPIEIDPTPLSAHLRGEGVFTIPYGPVRSGVFESIEYLVETPGEDILHLRARVFHKHRGIETRFEGMTPADGVLLAERYEGVASVAHAVAFSSAVEQIAGVEIPEGAGLLRVLHAELERVANHLESVIRHCEAAGQAVAFARFSLHKERVQRLRAAISGSRFGRGVVIPGGVSGPPGLGASALFSSIDQVEAGVRADLRLLMATPSFADRLRGTGIVSPEVARQFGALGPVGRGSGQMADARIDRPYAAYSLLGLRSIEHRLQGDALARQRARMDEIEGSFHIIRQAIDRMEHLRAGKMQWAVPVDLKLNGQSIGWAEAPQGEVLYIVQLEEGRLTRVKPRSASFHNLAMFQAAFPKDVLTDFAFIEASFGVSIAGVAG
ncbi:MAG: nickel-dependent hydrogenase large subunit [Actinomycetota bacterium]|nr:nickel-dependent hydrogenase large subunit [Actinomycetota bacterium]